MRVGIIGLLHESNTFFAKPTTLEDFRHGGLFTGEDVRREMAQSHHEVGGFFEGLAANHIDAVPLFMARALPGGAVAADALEAMIDMILGGIDQAGRLDGLLVAPHGAGVSEREPDMDGYWLTRLRHHVGPAMPIVCTLDAHANLTQKMIDAVNATILYRTNPHLDQRQRGVEAAHLLARTLRGEVRPTQAASFPPVAINIERQHTPSAPCKPMYDLADAMLRRPGEPGVLSNSIVLGFPYADVVEMGSAFVVVTDNDPALAQRLADELAAYLIQHRAEFAGQLVDVEEALDQAANAGGPVCLLDMGDNVGGGSPGDGTLIARAIQKRTLSTQAGIRGFVSLHDPTSLAAAVDAGIGARLRLRMGGRSYPVYGPPLEADVTVRGIYSGKFSETQVRHGGMRDFDMGPTAIVETTPAPGTTPGGSGLTIQLTTYRVFPTSILQVTSCGLDPASFNILIAKGVQAPVAAYAPFCKKLIRVNTPGVTDADMRRLEFKHRRRPLFPFEDL